MKKIISLILILVASLSIATYAVQTMKIGAQLSSNGTLLQGYQDITINLVNKDTGVVLWTDTYSDVYFLEGKFVVEIGEDPIIDPALLQDEVSFSFSVEGSGEASANIFLTSVPKTYYSESVKWSGIIGKPELDWENLNANTENYVEQTATANWNTAYNWGDHSAEGYLTSATLNNYVEESTTANWNTAYSWGDHSTAGYLTSPSLNAEYIHGDEINITGLGTTDVLKYDGTKWVPSSDAGQVYTAGTGISINNGEISNTGDTDGSNDITTASGVTANWNTAYSWGDHGVEGYLLDTTSFAGDISGTASAITVAKLQGRGISTSAPSTSQVLKWDGSEWAPSDDVGGSSDTTTTNAEYLQGRDIATNAPSTSQVLKWDGSEWVPSADNGQSYSAGTGISISVGNEISNTGDTDDSDDITVASSVTANWNEAYNWDNHADANYVAEADAVTGNWNTAFGWGDHGVEDYATEATLNNYATTATLNNYLEEPSYTWNWPGSQGGGSQVLQNDGSGNLSWTNLSGGGDVKSDGSVWMIGDLSVTTDVNIQLHGFMYLYPTQNGVVMPHDNREHHGTIIFDDGDNVFDGYESGDDAYIVYKYHDTSATDRRLYCYAPGGLKVEGNIRDKDGLVYLDFDGDMNNNIKLISFTNKDTQELGAIKGQTGTLKGQDLMGIKFESIGADYAEYLPRIRKKEKIEGGDIVGVFEGKISKKTKGADRVMVVSSMPIVLGNYKGKEQKDLVEPVAFVGQVPVKVLGKVKTGEYIIASGENDGVGFAVSAKNLTVEMLTGVVGQAWESSNDKGLKLITAAITPLDFPMSMAIKKENGELRKRLEKLEKVVERLNSRF
ncbi:hypothetical protein ACFL2K_04225 [Candidatus Margulisiibacteriota bacterium]